MRAGKMLPQKGIGFSNFAIDAAINMGGYALQGENFASSVVKGLGTSVLWNAIGPVGDVLVFGQLAAAGGTALYEGVRNKWDRVKARNYAVGRIGGEYHDTKAAYTMRQAAVQAISAARINGRQVLGNEASFMHR